MAELTEAERVELRRIAWMQLRGPLSGRTAALDLIAWLDRSETGDTYADEAMRHFLGRVRAWRVRVGWERAP